MTSHSDRITDAQVQEALEWMWEHAAPAAQAAADVITAEEGLKAAIALAASRAVATSVMAAEREARLTREVKVAVEGKAAAVYLEHKYRLQYTARKALIEVWRTMNANARAERVD